MNEQNHIIILSSYQWKRNDRWVAMDALQADIDFYYNMCETSRVIKLKTGDNHEIY